jgi:hypothetical protein
MNRFIPAVVIIVALVVAFILSRPKPVVDPVNDLTTVPARVLEGMAIPPQEVANLRIALTIAGDAVADSAVKQGAYRLELPSTIDLKLESLKDQQLVHGDGRLPVNAMGADTKLLMYDDQNKNSTLDTGEPQLEASLIVPNSNPSLRAFFRYKVLLLGSPVKFIETQDSATNAKGYYRYNLNLEKGWNILEGELTGGYDIRVRNENKWDILAALPTGGSTAPPAFTPQ